MKHIAKSRHGRLLVAVASFASSVRRTVAGRTAGVSRPKVSRSGMVRATRTIGASAAGSRVSLVPAHAGHFDWIARILREGAADGSFDAELAAESLASQVFFANLHRALETGCFLASRGDGAPEQTLASGYVYVLSNGTRPATPLGFTMFKSIGSLGFELWLAAVDRRYRGRGFCKAMLAAALATPAGMLAHVARVNRAGRHGGAIGRALESAGYRVACDGPGVRWFVRGDAPEALVRVVRDQRER